MTVRAWLQRRPDLRKSVAIAALVGVALIAVARPASAQRISQERVSFETGSFSATLEGSITGYGIADYLLGARAGQMMSVGFETDNTISYFNVLLPESEAAIFIGSTSGNEWTGVLPSDGTTRFASA